MASITLSRKRGIYAGTANSWTTISGSTIIGDNYNCHCVYRTTVNMTGASKLNSVTFKNTFSSDITGSVTFKFYLYTSDPTGSGSPPSGYIGSQTLTRTVTPVGLANTGVTFSGLNLSSVTELYVWVTGTYNASTGGVYCCDESGISQRTEISGSFSAAVTSLQVTPNRVVAGNKVSLVVTNGSGYTLTAVFKYGNTVLPVNGNPSVTFTNGTVNVTCPKDWFDTAGVTALTEMTISVTVTGGTSTMTGSFTLAASTAMQPTVENVTEAVVQSTTKAAQAYPNTYIAGISKVKVTAKVTANTNAAISTVTLSYPGGTNVTMQYNNATGKYEGTTAAPITQDTTFTVRAVDARRLYKDGSVAVSGVVAYTPPSVIVNNAFRCNDSGSEESGGPKWKIQVTESHSSALSGNTVTIKAGIKNGAMNTIRSGQLEGPYTGTTNPTSAYVVLITIQDKVSDDIRKEITLPGIKRDFVLNHDGGHTHLGIGTTPVGKDFSGYKDTIEVPHDGLFLMGGIPVQAFNYPHIAGKTSDNPCFGRDFRNVSAERTGEANASAIFGFPASQYSEWTNVPEDPFDSQTTPTGIKTLGWAGWREVYFVNQDVVLVKITEIAPKAGRVWFCSRAKNSATHEYTWGRWKYLMPTSV